MKIDTNNNKGPLSKQGGERASEWDRVWKCSNKSAVKWCVDKCANGQHNQAKKQVERNMYKQSTKKKQPYKQKASKQSEEAKPNSQRSTHTNMINTHLIIVRTHTHKWYHVIWPNYNISPLATFWGELVWGPYNFDQMWWDVHGPSEITSCILAMVAAPCWKGAASSLNILRSIVDNWTLQGMGGTVRASICPNEVFPFCFWALWAHRVHQWHSAMSTRKSMFTWSCFLAHEQYSTRSAYKQPKTVYRIVHSLRVNPCRKSTS